MLRAGMKGNMNMPSLQGNPTRKIPREHLKDIVDSVEKFGHKGADCPNKKQPK